MSGYVPLFSSLTTGTLCGRWPDVGLWPIVLSLSDRHGVIDVTPAYISSVTGLPIDEVIACMKRFCQPDPYSRTSECNGARLQLVDEHRDWGWRIVNHSKYRERARLQSKNAAEVASGKNAARLSNKASTATADSRRTPPKTAAERPSDSDKTKQDKKEEALAIARAVAGLNLDSFNEWIEYRKALGEPIKSASMKALAKKLARFGDQQAAVVTQSIENGWQGLFPVKLAAYAGNTNDIEHRQAREFPS